MAFQNHFPIFASFLLLLLLVLSTLPNPSLATTRKLTSLFTQPALVLDYHNGPLLKGEVRVDIIWYGSFSSHQRSIITNFIRSLGSASASPPSVASWWQTTANYKGGPSNIVLGKQTVDQNCSLGKSLTSSQLLDLASKPPYKNRIKVVLTAADVTVDQFCMICGSHDFGYKKPQVKRGKFAYAWVGNSASQCPGQCAWPFYRPEFGPQTTLVAPNGDGALDGMVINLATVLAGAVTNPFNNGYYQGPQGGLEAVTACAGLYGPGSFPGNVGSVMVDPATGASYNAQGVDGCKYLLPAMWDPVTSACLTLV
ncbi:hypothetical protein RHSIM_Rhsim07G0204100 [Rhododendron simsii]|uniref:Uncharacterized protein n=1 Tax=Rhododendron simsii TaxID=118357 RepID=A0A834GRS1_RHOSS|nr:hypothetical protein RHSIM_Rhsim07G0204100 [Rhododendron simsii]